MNSFMKTKLFAKSKKYLALLLAAVMVTGGMPATTASAAETSVTDESNVSIVPEGTGEAVGQGAETPTTDGEDSNLVKYSLDTENFVEALSDRGCSTKAEYRSQELNNYLYYWTATWMRNNNIIVMKNGEELCSLGELSWKEGLSYTTKWQVKKGDKFEDLQSAPTLYSPAGIYQLLIEIPEVKDVSAAMSEGIIFEITPTELSLEVSFGEYGNGVEPGTKAKDVKAEVTASARVYNYSDYGYGWYSYEYLTATDDAETSPLKAEVTVVDAYTGAALKEDDVLLKTGDYYAQVVVSMTDKATEEQKANFVLPETTVNKKLEMADLIETYITLTPTDKWKNENGSYDTYTTSFDGEDVAAPVEKVDYTIEIGYYGENEQGEYGLQPITFAAEDITYEWYDNDEGVWLDKAPVDAGYYTYYVNYAGKAGLYASSKRGMTVYVAPKELTLIPKWKNDEVPEFYPGMNTDDVLDYIDYIAVDAKGQEVTIDKDHIWGNRNNSGRTYSYEPVFEVQIEWTENAGTENEKKVYGSFDGSLNYGNNYRVAFSGQKATYYLSGGYANYYSINNYTGNADSNYCVNVEESVLDAKVLPVTVNPGKAAVLDASALLVNGAGVSFGKPITKTYDGEPIYEERAEYKIAKVLDASNGNNVIAEGADSSISYIWFAMNEDATGQNTWRQLWYGSSYEDFKNYRNSPVDAGNYMLQIYYRDPANEYHASSAVIYYRIEPQKIQVVPVKVPSVLTETAEYSYDYDAIEYEIRVASSHDGADGTTDGADAGATLTLTEDDYEIYWGIEEATAEKPSEYNDFHGTFTKGNSYRVKVDNLYLYSNANGISNYIDYTETEKNGVVTRNYFHETAPIELVNMGTEVLEVVVDKTKLSATSKVYDGERWDLSKDIENGLVKVVKASNKSAVTDVELDYWWVYEEEDGATWYSNAQYKAGKYTIIANYPGDATYAPVKDTEVAVLTIEPKELTAEVVISGSVVAGTYACDNFDEMSVVFDGVAERDASYFNYALYNGFMGMNHYEIVVKDAKGNEVDYWSDVLRGKETYTVEFKGELDSVRERNYKLTGKVTTFTTVRGNSVVTAAGYDNFAKATIADSIKDMEHSIKPMAAVPYSYNAYNGVEVVSGNYVTLRIRRPYEYEDADYSVRNDASFENSITKAGGYVLASDSYGVYVAFDAAAKDTKSFEICWEPGYVEKFTLDFTNAVMMANMEEAVAPKSLALISPAKKMAVGEEQWLDVKITKKEMADVICLGYGVDDGTVLCVDETGHITALKTGKATVTVYPAKYDSKTGEKVAIEGAKSVAVTITVSEVSAPKLGKLRVRDDNARVNITAIKDGARREVYVLPGKGIKADVFEQKIAAMEQQHWRGFFATEPGYTTARYATYVDVYGLEPGKDYTVYVRNTSRPRTATEYYYGDDYNNEYSRYCEDGCKVAVSAKGTVKSFKTTKSQVEDLKITYDEKQPVTYNEGYGRYEIPLTKKSVTFSALGAFWEKAYKPAADDMDMTIYPLPLKGDHSKSYQAPKLVYYVAERTTDPNWNKAIWWEDGWATEYDSDYDETYYFQTTSRATIAKSGKLTMKGAGQIWIAVGDTVSGTLSEWRPFTITVKPDKLMINNKVKMQVGQSVQLSQLVTYYEGKTQLSGSFNKTLVLTEESKKAINESEYFKSNSSGSIITAIKAGGTLNNLQIKDVYWNLEAAGAISTVEMTPVKNLKATMVVDKFVKMSFADAGRANKVKVEAIDASGRIVDSDLYYLWELYNEDTKLYEFSVQGLTKQSKYTVQVTAVYDDEDGVYVESKMVKKAVKTTKVPVSYTSLDKYTYGGENIGVYGPAGNLGAGTYYTGNTYTFYITADNSTAADSLIWTSSNKKVGTIKANGGSGTTFTANFKATKAGSTVIEVKSKISKQVIARHTIYVNEVGDAAFFYGDEQSLFSVGAKQPAMLKKQ